MFFEYLSLTFANWDYLGWGVGGAILISLAHLRKKTFPLWVAGAWLIATFVISSYFVWKEQKIAAANAQAEIERLSKPQLVIEMSQITHSFTPEDGSNGIILVVGVSNNGSPSTCRRYQFSIDTIDNRIVSPNHVTDLGGINFELQGVPLNIPFEEDLSQVTAETPIERGGREVGYLQYEVESRQIADLTAELGTVYHLSCEDNTGQRFEGVRTRERATSDPYKAIPGLTIRRRDQ